MPFCVESWVMYKDGLALMVGILSWPHLVRQAMWGSVPSVWAAISEPHLLCFGRWMKYSWNFYCRVTAEAICITNGSTYCNVPMPNKLHIMDLLWEKFQWIQPLYMKPISFQSKASVVCSVTAAIFIDFCLKKLNVFSQHIGQKTNQYLNFTEEILRNWKVDQLSV